jgi:hypothetical protein
MLIKRPSHGTQFCGAKFPANIRISPKYGSAMSFPPRFGRCRAGGQLPIISNRNRQNITISCARANEFLQQNCNFDFASLHSLAESGIGSNDLKPEVPFFFPIFPTSGGPHVEHPRASQRRRHRFHF